MKCPEEITLLRTKSPVMIHGKLHFHKIVTFVSFCMNLFDNSSLLNSNMSNVAENRVIMLSS